MRYTDKDLQLATQIAYMNFNQDDINQYYGKNGEYPTIKWLLTDYEYKQDIIDEYMRIYDMDALPDSIAGKRRDAAQKIIDDIISGESECADWKIVLVDDQNENTGMYGVLIETSENKAIVGFRGSESYNDEQFMLDWLEADFGLLDSTATKQQDDAEAFIDMISDFEKQYDSYVLTGHSTAGNHAQFVTIA